MSTRMSWLSKLSVSVFSPGSWQAPVPRSRTYNWGTRCWGPQSRVTRSHQNWKTSHHHRSHTPGKVRHTHRIHPVRLLKKKRGIHIKMQWNLLCGYNAVSRLSYPTIILLFTCKKTPLYQKRSRVRCALCDPLSPQRESVMQTDILFIMMSLSLTRSSPPCTQGKPGTVVASIRAKHHPGFTWLEDDGRVCAAAATKLPHEASGYIVEDENIIVVTAGISFNVKAVKLQLHHLEGNKAG